MDADAPVPPSGDEDHRRGKVREPLDEPTGQAAPPELLDAIRQLGSTGRAGLGAAGDATKAMRSLVAADLSLAGSALARAGAYAALAAVLGATAWLLLMATLVVFLSQTLGVAWVLSLLVTGVLSALLAAFGVWRALRYLRHTRLQATRRQLARLDLGEMVRHARAEPAAPMPDAAREDRP